MNTLMYKYRTISVDHLYELQADIDLLKQKHMVSDHKIYQEYIEKLQFKLLEDFPTAKFLLILAVYSPLVKINFQWQGKSHEVLIPTQYNGNKMSPEELQKVIRKDILKDPKSKIKRAEYLHLKLLAVRSGLGKYGRNNICYIDGMGSFHYLYAFFTDHKFEKDNWTSIAMMPICEKCRICRKKCPTGAIQEENFVIDAGKCITLYNERPGEFPSWIIPKTHNALLGCMQCQLYCPVNQNVRKQFVQFDDITEEETAFILSQGTNQTLLASVIEKLKIFALDNVAVDLPTIRRNLEVLLK
ncbi:MAG: 4Fe-4S double cluster binding domain-containing protein [Promethearchaeota archaeon]